jgi:hypothetical protein
MTRALFGLVVAASGLAFWCEIASAQTAVQRRTTATGRAPLLTTQPAMKDRLDRIAAGSALWRDAMATLRRMGRHAIILVPDEVVVQSAADDTQGRDFDREVLAETFPVSEPDSSVHSVIVVVNVPLLKELHDQQGSLPGEYDADLDRILVHEVYAHAVPYLMAGDLSGKCADPAPRQRATESCAIQRENAVRRELRLGRRVDAGLEALSISRRGNWMSR